MDFILALCFSAIGSAAIKKMGFPNISPIFPRIRLSNLFFQAMLAFSDLIAIASAEGADNTTLFVPTPGFSGFGQPSEGRIWPYNANTPEFLRALESSNATGVFKIPGYNISRPFGEPICNDHGEHRHCTTYENVDGWTLSMSALEMPGLGPLQQWEAEQNNETAGANSTLGFSITVKAPEVLVETDPSTGEKRVDAHPTWGMCMWLLDPQRQETNANIFRYPGIGNKTLTEDGSCERYLTPECIDAILGNIGAYDALVGDTDSPYGSVVKCQDASAFTSMCGSSGGPDDDTSLLEPHTPDSQWNNIPTPDGIPITYLNGSVTFSHTFRVKTPEQRAKYVNSTASREVSIQEQYQKQWDDMVLNVWPVVTLIMNATVDPAGEYIELIDNWGKPYKKKKERKGVVSLSCVAPNGVGTGRAFTFSGEKPGTPPAPPDEEEDGQGPPVEEKYNGAVGSMMVSKEKGLALVLVWAWVWAMGYHLRLSW